jgi:hypothetical protein
MSFSDISAKAGQRSSIGSGQALSESIAALDKQRFGPNWIKPDYGSFCFSGIPGFIEKTLSGQTSRQELPKSISKAMGSDTERVILVFLDAFGWEAYERFFEKSVFLKTLASQGITCKTTSQFPSTTAAHVTTLCSGKPVYESGVCEWYYYEPKVGAVINPFQLSTITAKKKDSLLHVGFPISDILPVSSFTEDLHAKGILSTQSGPAEFFPSTYSKYLNRNAEFFPYLDLSAAIENIITPAHSSATKQYEYLYIGEYDSLRHRDGPYSESADFNARHTLKQLERLLSISNKGKTLLILTADHGQVTISQDTEVVINKEIPEIRDYLKCSPDGNLIRFGGGPRDLFMYARDGAEEALKSLLLKRLNGVAEVYTQNEAASLGILGPLPVSQIFKERMGNVLILPHLGHSVVWDEPAYYERDIFKGHHGGLTTQEMETPLAMIRL